MNKVGYALMLTSCLIWILGGRSVQKENYKRLGKSNLTFEIPNLITLIKQFNALEKRKLFLFFMAALIIGGVGSALANGACE